MKPLVPMASARKGVGGARSWPISLRDATHATPVVLHRFRSLQLERSSLMRLKTFMTDVTAPSLDDLLICLPAENVLACDEIEHLFSTFVSSSRYFLITNSICDDGLHSAVPFTSHIQINLTLGVVRHSWNSREGKGFS